MYDAKYRKYVTKSLARFAETHEILEGASEVSGDSCSASGIPVYYDGDRLYVDDSDNHSICVGPTASKKSRTVVFSTVNSIIKAGESALITDPKAEIFQRTAGLARECGADVYVLNFRNPETSHCWNPFTQASRLFHSGKITEATQCVNDFVDAACSQSEMHTTDRYWVDCAKSFLNSLILMLVASVPEEYCNISNLIPMCYECNADALDSMLTDMDETSAAAFGLHTVLDLQADRTKSCIYSMLLSIMSIYTQNIGLQNMLSCSSFDISEIGRRQTIVYVVYPDEKNSLNFLVNAFFTQCYETLISTAAENHENHLSKRVNFVYEEFSNLVPISNFDNRISEARSRGIRYFLFCQSFSQLEQKYNKDAETILANCTNWLCFSSRETAFLQKISAVCGKEIDYNGIEHDLVDPFIMQHLKKAREYAEVLLIRQGMYPYIVRLPDIDYIRMFQDIERAQIPDCAPPRNAKVISFSEWITRISSGEFKFPFPKNQSVDRCNFDLQAELNAKFNELFDT